MAAKLGKKEKMIWGSAILGAVACTLLIVGRAQAAESLGFSINAATATGGAPDDVTVLVLDQSTGKPVADAQVTLADSLERAGSPSQTGIDGTLSFSHGLAISRSKTALTVYKTGYTAISIVGFGAGVAGDRGAEVTVLLKPLPAASIAAAPTVLASGTITGWAGNPPRDAVTAGLVLRSLTAFDLLHFEAGSLISPIYDTINLFGTHDIPSNIVLPQQDVSLIIGSIHLNKPNYRLPVTRGRELHLVSVQGTIGARDLMAAAQAGKDASLEILNKLKFSRVGVTGAMTPQKDFKQDMKLTSELKPTHKVTVSASPFKADILVAAAADMDGDRNVLVPTDIKLAASAGAAAKPVSLNANASTGKLRDVVTIAMGDKGSRLSGIVTENAGATVTTGAFLSIDALTDSTTLPATVSFKPVATGLAAAVYESEGTPVWYVYSLPQAGSVTVPSKQIPNGAGDKVSAYSVVNLDFGTGFKPGQIDGRTAMKGLLRFARANAHVGEKPKPGAGDSLLDTVAAD
jgi:hypothetical protein